MGKRETGEQTDYESDSQRNRQNKTERQEKERKFIKELMLHRVTEDRPCYIITLTFEYDT